ncbi:MAG: hypothetical protein K8I30_15770, partial [Anaerolineae bacterium]|nr:hypothetical protein [Anaerolineae bacterium]
LEGIRAYFYLLPEQFAYVMATWEKQERALPEEWAQADALLNEAYRKRRYAERRARMESFSRTAEGFNQLLSYAAGFASLQSSDSALSRLERFGKLDGQNNHFILARTNPTSPQIDWKTVYDLLEAAMRLVVPVLPPQKVEWINLHPAADATRINQGGETWEAFGRPQSYTIAPLPPFGWAIRSPLLALSAGVRRVNLTLTFDPDGLDAGAIRNALAGGVSPFVVQVSSESGWIEPAPLNISFIEPSANVPPALQFDLTFDEKADPLAPFPDWPLPQPEPVLRIMLRQFVLGNERYGTRYTPFQNLSLAQVHLAVTVTGLTPTQMQNDDTVLPPNKPFEPFGTFPFAGSRFYLGHPELIDKPLTSLTFHLGWMGAPPNLTTHYANYGIDGKIFQTNISLVDDGRPRQTQTNALFADMTDTSK